MAAPVVISGGRPVGVVSAPYAALREAVTEVTRALEDQAWTNLSDDNRRQDAPYEERKALIERSRRFVRRHPLAKQAGNLLVNYCLGSGITLRANDMDKVARLVDEFWENPVNQSVFTSHAAMADAVKGTFSDGDLFLVLFPDKEQGTLELGIIDALFVEDIIGDKNNWRVAKWYKVRKPKGHYDFTTGVWVPETGHDFVWYRDWQNDEEVGDPEKAERDDDNPNREAEIIKPKRRRGKKAVTDKPDAVEDGLVYHISINRRGLFGEPETAAALDWLKAHKDFMEDRATINRAASTIAWRKKQKGTVASVQAEAARMRSALSVNQGWDSNPPPAAGSTVIENENSSMEWVRTDTGGAAALNDERILRMMVGSGMGGIPNHIFGDEAAANLATATAMGTPMHKSYEQWQTLLADVIHDLLDFMLETAHNAGRIGPKDDTSKYQDTKEQTDKGVLDTPQAKQIGPGARQLAAGQVREHGSPDDPDYEAKYHPGYEVKGQNPAAAKTGFAQRSSKDELRTDTELRYFLDDGRWNPQRVAIHDKYVADVQKGVPTTEEPVVYWVGGGTASGKSSTVDSGVLGYTTDGVAEVNADHAKERLPEYQSLLDLKDKAAANTVHNESSHMSKRALYESLANNHSVLYDAVGDNGIANVAKKVQQMRDHGATKVFGDYMTVPLSVALARMEKRFEKEGRWIAPSLMRIAYKDLPGTVAAAFEQDIFDRLRLYDNDKPMGDPPILIAEKERGGELVIHDKDRWQAYVGKHGRALVKEHGDPERDADYYSKFHPRTKQRSGVKPSVPTAKIEWLVDRMHADTPDAEVEADIRRRVDDEWSPEQVGQAVKIALDRHHANRATYNDYRPPKMQEHGDPDRDPADYRMRFHPGPSGTVAGQTKENPAATVIRGHEQEFKGTGGAIHVMTDRADEQAALMSLYDMNAAFGGGWIDDLGPQFTRRAIGAHRWGDEVTIAHDDEGLAGAMSWEDMDQWMHLNVLGTTGITKGAGSALTAWALRRAAEKDQGILLEPLGEAANFWRMMGMHEMPQATVRGNRMWGMTAEEVAEVVAGLN